MKGFTYKKSGVDIKKADLFKDRLKTLLGKSYSAHVLKGVGGFGGLFKFPRNTYKEPILVSSSDGVGTKLKIALSQGKHDTVGIDLVAMNVNDILCVGAQPLFFLDYLSYSKLSSKVLLDIVKGINAGCALSGCSLIGGETAQMPGMYKKDEYDLAGFCVGVIERSKIIDGTKIKKGNLVVGLESSGIHSNGYSLVRKVLSRKDLKKFGKQLLRPTRIYVKPIIQLLNSTSLKSSIKGISHITGGAFYGKISRILPKRLDVRIDGDSWEVPELFQLVQQRGRIENKEMYSTFNMGIGMVLIVEAKSAKDIIQRLKKQKVRSWIIGEVVKGKGKVYIV